MKCHLIIILTEGNPPDGREICLTRTVKLPFFPERGVGFDLEVGDYGVTGEVNHSYWIISRKLAHVLLDVSSFMNVAPDKFDEYESSFLADKNYRYWDGS